MFKNPLKSAPKIRFGISVSYRTEPNNTELKLRYSVNSVRSYTENIQFLDPNEKYNKKSVLVLPEIPSYVHHSCQLAFTKAKGDKTKQRIKGC